MAKIEISGGGFAAAPGLSIIPVPIQFLGHISGRWSGRVRDNVLNSFGNVGPALKSFEPSWQCRKERMTLATSMPDRDAIPYFK
jgi:hypothetical protein